MSVDFIPAVPGSRSIAARALVCAGLAHGTSELSNIPDCDDTVAITTCVSGLGAIVHQAEAQASLTGFGTIAPSNAVLDCLASGTTMRFVSALSLLTEQPIMLTGTPRLLERPMAGLVDVLTALGKSVHDDGVLRTISGSPLIPDQIEVDASTSGQFVSGLIMALANCGKSTQLRALKPVSIPFINMTVAVMKSFGAQVSVVQDGADLLINLAGDGYKCTEYAIEPDIMSANYFLSAAAITGKPVFIPNISQDTVQGDIDLVYTLERMGAVIEFKNGGIRSSRPTSERLRGSTIDLRTMPDMCLTFAALASVAQGQTVMTSARILKFKESDRLGVIKSETSKLGAHVEVSDDDDTITITPDATLMSASIDTFDDHRVAMAYGLLTLVNPNIVINNPECVSKTWPRYFEELLRYRNA